MGGRPQRLSVLSILSYQGLCCDHDLLLWMLTLVIWLTYRISPPLSPFRTVLSGWRSHCAVPPEGAGTGLALLGDTGFFCTGDWPRLPPFVVTCSSDCRLRSVRFYEANEPQSTTWETLSVLDSRAVGDGAPAVGQGWGSLPHTLEGDRTADALTQTTHVVLQVHRQVPGVERGQLGSPLLPEGERRPRTRREVCGPLQAPLLPSLDSRVSWGEN